MRIKSIQLSPALVFVLLAAAIVTIYSNTLDVPWHLDDYHNIVINDQLKSQGLGTYGLVKTCVQFFKTALSSRPLAMSSFAINWYIGGNSTLGYHIVNIAIHIFASWILLLTCRLLLETPSLSGRYSPNQVFFVSLLAACLWALNPIQVQAVTYIVQRMASMAALFYILGIYLFLKGRLNDKPMRRWLYYMACLFSWLTACLSKENAFLLPLSLLLVETVFFQDISRRKVKIKMTAIVAGVGLLMALGGALIFLNGNLQGIFVYDERFFSTGERLLTQGRILIFYLTLLIYPVPNRLSIAHDIEVSTSMLHPWSTLPSLLIIFFLVGGAIFKIRKWPLVSFAVLFFFLNHAIESTIIPLELIFEHRNYLPSLFFYLPIAAGLQRVMELYKMRSRIVSLSLTTFVALMLVGLGAGTYIRNMVWHTEKLLWEDALSKAPNASRPFHYLAWVYQQQAGDDATALVLYQKALKRQRNNKVQESQIYNNMAAIFYHRAAYALAATYWLKSLEIQPDVPELRYRLALALTRNGNLEAAAQNLQMVISNQSDYVDAIRLQAIVYLMENDDASALPLLRKALRLRPQDVANLVNLAAYYQRNAESRKAIVFLREALKIDSDEPMIHTWLIMVSTELGHTDAAYAHWKQLFELKPAKELSVLLNRWRQESICADRMICPKIDDRLLRSLKAHAEVMLDFYSKPILRDPIPLQSISIY